MSELMWDGTNSTNKTHSDTSLALSVARVQLKQNKNPSLMGSESLAAWQRTIKELELWFFMPSNAVASNAVTNVERQTQFSKPYVDLNDWLFNVSGYICNLLRRSIDTKQHFERVFLGRETPAIFLKLSSGIQFQLLSFQLIQHITLFLTELQTLRFPPNWICPSMFVPTLSKLSPNKSFTFTNS